MRPFVVRPFSRLKGEIFLSGDKSIAHRSIIISAVSCGTTRIENFPANEDCLSTIKAFKKLGVRITQDSSTVTVRGVGLLGLKKPKRPILVGDSGTTLRILLGVLAGQNFKTKLVAGSSLSQRPMRRVTGPLRMMGAKIKARVRRQDAKLEEYPPITIKGGSLRPVTYEMPVASAQVKSAIILAALYAKGKTCVRERVRSRDHTERMLKLFKADIKINPSARLRVDGERPSTPLGTNVLECLDFARHGSRHGELVEPFIEGRSRTINQNTIVIKGNKELVSPGILTIPGDVSSAAFFIVLAAIIADSIVYIRNVSLNPSRTGIIRVLKRMGADIKVRRSTFGGYPEARGRIGEPAGDILVKSSHLRGTIVRKDEVPSLIDELPVLMVAASNAKGRTVFEGVSELRVKETDRIRSLSCNLRKMGADITVFSATNHGRSANNFGGKTDSTENIIIRGVKQLKGARVRSFGDHRTAMSMVVAALAAIGNTRIDDISCINKSFPGFLDVLDSLMSR